VRFPPWGGEGWGLADYFTLPPFPKEGIAQPEAPIGYLPNTCGENAGHKLEYLVGMVFPLANGAPITTLIKDKVCGLKKKWYGVPCKYRDTYHC